MCRGVYCLCLMIWKLEIGTMFEPLKIKIEVEPSANGWYHGTLMVNNSLQKNLGATLIPRAYASGDHQWSKATNWEVAMHILTIKIQNKEVKSLSFFPLKVCTLHSCCLYISLCTCIMHHACLSSCCQVFVFGFGKKLHNA